jgi:hypothetical protein
MRTPRPLRLCGATESPPGAPGALSGTGRSGQERAEPPLLRCWKLLHYALSIIIIMGVPPVCDVNRHIWPRDADAYQTTSFQYCACPRAACRAGVRRAQPGGGAAARADGYSTPCNPRANRGATHADRSAARADSGAAQPTVALPTPEPTLTVPEAIDRILSGEKPVETLVTLFAWQPALLRWLSHGAGLASLFPL